MRQVIFVFVQIFFSIAFNHISVNSTYSRLGKSEVEYDFMVVMNRVNHTAIL